MLERLLIRRSGLDRYTWPVAIVVLVFAVATVSVAAVQSIQLRDAYEQRDRALASAGASYVREYLTQRLSEQVEWTSQQPELLSLPPGELAERIQLDYLADGVNEPVIAVAVLDRDGQIAVWRWRGGSIIGTSNELLGEVSRQLMEVGEEVSETRLHTWRAIVLDDERRLYAQAQPLASDRYGAWINVIDAEATPLGEFFAVERGPAATSLTLVAEDGAALIGTLEAGAVRERVSGTSWEVAAGRTSTPRTVPTWAFILLLGAILVLGASYLVQDRARRRLREEAEQAAERASALYGLAHELLEAQDLDEQAHLLAEHVHVSLGVDEVEVRIIGASTPVISSGTVPEHPRTWRLAISGPAGPIGELRVVTAHRRIGSAAQRDARTVAAIAGAALHTQLVVQRERDTTLELQRLDELRRNLLSTVAHELRSPLAAVKGVLGLLGMSGELSEQHREYVGVANERTDALVALIGDLFARSLLDSGALQLERQWTSAHDIAQRALAAVATTRPGDVQLEVDPGLELEVDPLRIDQVVGNLLANALRHGEPPVVVRIQAAGAGARISVADAGPGVPESERERIFDRFYQSSGSNTGEGAGLGLSLVQGLVEAHGGSVRFESAREDGSGACFIVELPAARTGSASAAREAS